MSNRHQGGIADGKHKWSLSRTASVLRDILCINEQDPLQSGRGAADRQNHSCQQTPHTPSLDTLSCIQDTKPERLARAGRDDPRDTWSRHTIRFRLCAAHGWWGLISYPAVSPCILYCGRPQCSDLAQHQRRCSVVVLPAAAGMGGFCDTITKAIVSKSNPYHVDEMIYT
jgi:hypothetical protein